MDVCSEDVCSEKNRFQEEDISLPKRPITKLPGTRWRPGSARGEALPKYTIGRRDCQPNWLDRISRFCGVLGAMPTLTWVCSSGFQHVHASVDMAPTTRA